MKYTDIYIMGDQPTTCPICGVRTEIIQEFLDAPEMTQYHQCLSDNCQYTFTVMEN